MGFRSGMVAWIQPETPEPVTSVQAKPQVSEQRPGLSAGQVMDQGPRELGMATWWCPLAPPEPPSSSSSAGSRAGSLGLHPPCPGLRVPHPPGQTASLQILSTPLPLMDALDPPPGLRTHPHTWPSSAPPLSTQGTSSTYAALLIPPRPAPLAAAWPLVRHSCDRQWPCPPPPPRPVLLGASSPVLLHTLGTVAPTSGVVQGGRGVLVLRPTCSPVWGGRQHVPALLPALHPPHQGPGLPGSLACSPQTTRHLRAGSPIRPPRELHGGSPAAASREAGAGGQKGLSLSLCPNCL